ncbi:Beta-galactosidase 17 -like protein [Gossypium arboreum]|uniref:Beta-galactosidase n=1 Tax=Gossypium arboreum TaxID=29729 RepID=A0A0B0N7B9_GOSAR|nr:Beta-galactosidase 17 -like protein [Gossypium arboreum]
MNRSKSLAATSKSITAMARKRSSKTTLIFFLLLSLLAFLSFLPVFASLPSLPSYSHSHDLHFHLPRHQRLHRRQKISVRKFEIAEDKFWKDGKPFQIIGGDLHYFRVLPEYWEDRLLRAKALGLNTVQTYIPWNLHEPEAGKLVFEGIADLVSFLKLCQKLGLLVMLRAGPYICAEWDLGGFPAWLLSIHPDVRLRSSDPAYLQKVEGWWGVLLPKVAPLLYGNGGPIIMVQIENEFGSYGNDKAYLSHLVKLARGHLGEDIILYTTDGGSRETLEKGTIQGDGVFAAVDFTTGDNPWPIFKLQKQFNSPGKSPPLSSEFYTGWLTHWSEKMARTDADFTAAALEKIMLQNGSVVLYMAHGGTNFGFYNGANTGADESDYKPDLTSYDYDAPITESGDVDNAKFKAIRRVMGKFSSVSLPSVPPNNKKTGYGSIQLKRTAFLFDLLDEIDPLHIVEAESPTAMEYLNQMFGFVLYVSEYVAKTGGSKLVIPKVENMGRVNYGPYIFDRKGILSSVYVDGSVLKRWKMISIPFHNLNEVPKFNPVIQVASKFHKVSAGKKLEHKSVGVGGPSFYTGHFSIDTKTEVTDTYISLRGWGKGIAFVNEFNIGRYWPTSGPPCNLYIPAPILRQGENVLVIFELESPNPELMVDSVDQPDFTCGPGQASVHQNEDGKASASLLTPNPLGLRTF